MVGANATLVPRFLEVRELVHCLIPGHENDTKQEVALSRKSVCDYMLSFIHIHISHCFIRPSHKPLSRRAPSDSSLKAVTDPTNGTVTGVLLNFDSGRESVTLSRTCARTLEYPGRMYVSDRQSDPGVTQDVCSLDNSRREDLALIGSQFWLLGISTFGVSSIHFLNPLPKRLMKARPKILYNSIPHM